MGRIYGNGLNQSDLVDLISLIKTNWNAILAKLDADGTVNSTDYAATYAVSLPSGIKTTGSKGIHDQGLVATFLNSVVAKFNLALAHLDADTGVSGTNYVSTTAMSGSLNGQGFSQSALVHLLDHILTKINALNAKLDLDGGVADTNYASLWNVTDTVDATGTAA